MKGNEVFLGIGLGLLMLGGCFWVAGKQQMMVELKDDVNEEKSKIEVVIIPHHLLALELIQKSLMKIKNPSTIEEVIIVSPDHFKQLSRQEKYLIAELGTKAEPRKEDNDGNYLAVRMEHGIRAVQPVVADFFPKAGIKAIIVGNHLDSNSDLRELGRSLAEGGGGREEVGKGEKSEPRRKLLVISSDFSHETTKAEAQKNDRRSIGALLNLNRVNETRINNDCPNCWSVVQGFLEGEKCVFVVVDNKNSTDFGGEDRNVTSYVVGNWRCRVDL